MFEPERLPAPDDCGQFYHPDIPGGEESDDVRKLLLGLGYELSVVEFEYDAPETLTDAFDEGELSALAQWVPTPPAGDGWLLVAKNDNEYCGPVALFVRKK